MINQIISSVIITLKEEFGSEYEVYMEEYKQDLKKPCFFIQCSQPTIQRYLGKRCQRTNPIHIQYYPRSEEHIREECNDVAERMIWCLEYISLDKQKYLGTKMKYEMIEGILNFFVNYDFFVYRVAESTPMEIMQYNHEVKEGDEYG